MLNYESYPCENVPPIFSQIYKIKNYGIVKVTYLYTIQPLTLRDPDTDKIRRVLTVYLKKVDSIVWRWKWIPAVLGKLNIYN